MALLHPDCGAAHVPLEMSKFAPNAAKGIWISLVSRPGDTEFVLECGMSAPLFLE